MKQAFCRPSIQQRFLSTINNETNNLSFMYFTTFSLVYLDNESNNLLLCVYLDIETNNL